MNTADKTETARLAFVAYCEEIGSDSITEEEAIRAAVSRDMIPGNGEPSVEYYEWLTEGVRAAQAEHDREIAAGHEWHETQIATSRALHNVAPTCDHCGHPIAPEGVTLDDEDDVDTTGQDRPRCSDSACTC